MGPIARGRRTEDPIRCSCANSPGWAPGTFTSVHENTPKASDELLAGPPEGVAAARLDKDATVGLDSLFYKTVPWFSVFPIFPKVWSWLAS